MASAVLLSCDDIRSLLAERLKGRPTRANFRTGHVTVCTLVPMRSIRTGWCACSGWTTAASPATSSATATTSPHATSGSATAMRAAKIVSSCSTRCWRPRITSSSRTPVATSDPISAARPPFPSGSCSTWWSTRCEPRRAASATPSCSSIRCSRSTSATSSATNWCRTGRGVSTHSTWPVPAPPWPHGTMPPPFLDHPLEPAAPAPSGSISWSASFATRCGRSSASDSTSGSGTGPGTSRTPSPSISTDWSSGRSPTACCRSDWEEQTSPTAWTPSGRVARCRPDSWPTPC